jgi:uncharacterized protein YbjT (DUF2867 family)
MRVVVVGATGNVGTSLVRALAGDAGIESVVGIARRLPTLDVAKTEWIEGDVSRSDLVPLLRGADTVVHLAWLIQPSHDPGLLHRVNVEGSQRVFEAVAEAGVRSSTRLPSARTPRVRSTGSSTRPGRSAAFGRASTGGRRPKSSVVSTCSSRSTRRFESRGCGRD